MIDGRFEFTARHVECLYAMMRGLWEPDAYVTLTPDGKGGIRVGVLSERPMWDTSKTNPHITGQRARQMLPEERHMDLDQLIASVNAKIAQP
jgi:hypothetical protein